MTIRKPSVMVAGILGDLPEDDSLAIKSEWIGSGTETDDKVLGADGLGGTTWKILSDESAIWGNITGDISDQTDLTPEAIGAATTAQGELADSAVQPEDNANTLGSGTETDDKVLGADGSGGTAWKSVVTEVVWGNITGDISDQTDLTPEAIGAATTAQGELADSAVQPNDNANTLGSGTETDDKVLGADGSGGTTWKTITGGAAVWGAITGDISDQTDLTPAAIGAATTAQGELADSALQPNEAISTEKITATREGEQLRLRYDEDNYATFAVGASGILTINPTGDFAQIIAAKTSATIGLNELVNGEFETDLSSWNATNWTWEYDTYIVGDDNEDSFDWQYEITCSTARHEAGTTDSLSQTVSLIEGDSYEVSFTIIDFPGGILSLKIDGIELYRHSGLGYKAEGSHKRSFVSTVTKDALLEFSPSIDCGCAISFLNFKRIVEYCPGSFRLRDSAGNNLIDFKGSGTAFNTAVGALSGDQLTTGSYNSIFGNMAGAKLHSGSNNTLLGYKAGYNITDAAANTLCGNLAGSSLETGTNNSFFGNKAGEKALYPNNTAVGHRAGSKLSIGANNLFLGSRAGIFYGEDEDYLVNSQDSIFIGFNTRALADFSDREIVIGNNITGLGSNTTIIGNIDNTKTAMFGDLGINITDPSARIHAISVDEQLRLGYDDDNYFSLTVNSTGEVEINAIGGVISFGGNSTDGVSIGNRFPLKGNTSAYGHLLYSEIQSDVENAFGYRSSLSVAAAEFTLATISHFSANLVSIGDGAAVTNQNGFHVAATVVGATNNYGFSSALDAATGCWNFYASGTAQNYLAGNLGIGTDTISAKAHIVSTTEQLRLGYDLTKYATFTLDAEGFMGIVSGISEPPVVADSGTAYTIGARSIYDITLTGNCTFTFPTPTAGRQFTVILNQGSVGSKTVTWPLTVRWANAAIPAVTATANKTDLFSFLAVGSVWLGFTCGQIFSRA